MRVRFVVPTSRRRAPPLPRTSGMRKEPPISTSSLRLTTTSRPSANVFTARSTAAALLLTTTAASVLRFQRAHLRPLEDLLDGGQQPAEVRHRKRLYPIVDLSRTVPYSRRHEWGASPELCRSPPPCPSRPGAGHRAPVRRDGGHPLSGPPAAPVPRRHPVRAVRRRGGHARPGARPPRPRLPRVARGRTHRPPRRLRDAPGRAAAR